MLPAPRSRIVLAYVAVSIIWGSTYLGILIAMESFPPFFLASLRFLFAGGVLMAYARVRGAPWPKTGDWASAILMGALFLVVGNGFLNFAEKTVSTGVSSILLSTMPLWTTVFARILGQPISRREAGGVGLAQLEYHGDQPRRRAPGEPGRRGPPRRIAHGVGVRVGLEQAHAPARYDVRHRDPHDCRRRRAPASQHMFARGRPDHGHAPHDERPRLPWHLWIARGFQRTFLCTLLEHTRPAVARRATPTSIRSWRSFSAPCSYTSDSAG